LTSGQDEAGGKQRIAGTILQITLWAKMKPPEDASLKITRRTLVTKFLFQQLMENLERAWSINEGPSRFSDHWQTKCRSIPIAVFVDLHCESGSESGRKIE
jgi:hypothetical protein